MRESLGINGHTHAVTAACRASVAVGKLPGVLALQLNDKLPVDVLNKRSLKADAVLFQLRASKQKNTQKC